MEQQKVIITNKQEEINEFLYEGWLIKMVIAQSVSTGGSSQLRGYFCFVLTKKK